MWDRIKKKWNAHFSTSIFFVALSMMASYYHQDLDKSLMYFGVAMIFIGLGSIGNDIQELKDKKEKEST